MAVLTGSDIGTRLAQAAEALGVSEAEVTRRALDAYLPPLGVNRCPVCGGSGVVHTGGQTKTCPQCGGSGVY